MGLWVNVDFRELEDLQKRIEKISQPQMTKFFDDCCKELAARLLGKVIPATPVGDYSRNVEKYKKEGGTLRRGWTAGKEQDPRVFAYSLPVQKVSDGYIITVENIVEYASFVEYDHRQTPGRFVPAIGKKLKQSLIPGKFMLTKSEIELGAELPMIIKRKMLKLLEDVFNGK